MKRFFTFLLIFSLVLPFFGCGEEKYPRPELKAEFPGQQVDFTFAPSESPAVTLSPGGAGEILAAVDAQKAEFPYADLYELDQIRARLDFDATVQTHARDGRNAGQPDSAHLTALVKANNEAYLATEPFGFQAVEEDYLRELCDFIVVTTREMMRLYPDLDWDRVWCNLGDLKILYNTGMLSFAQVNEEMILSISKNNTQIVLTLKGENSFSQVLVHELMHIIQLGCRCESIENCRRRAGISIYWEDFPLNSGDWTWLVEGSAERHMCKLTGGPAVSYQYKIDYICSFTMALLLRSEVAADTMENLCFQDDPEALFAAFGCQTPEERDQVILLMTTMNVLQMQPDAFYRAYEKAYGVNPKSDEDAMNQISYSLKPAVCITLTKEFYVNLVAFLRENEMPENDIYCLLRLFEGHLNQHLGYNVESRAQINAPFFEAYRAMRAEFLAVLSRETGIDMTAGYESFNLSAGENAIFGDFSYLPEEKRQFLLERAQWQNDQTALGTKVPEAS